MEIYELNERNEMYDIFLSYNWSIKAQVQILEMKLKYQGYKVWRDETDLKNGNQFLSSQLASAVKKSKIFICFITTEYCQSYNCNLELEYASSLAKPFTVLMINRLSISELSEILVVLV